MKGNGYKGIRRVWEVAERKNAGHKRDEDIKMGNAEIRRLRTYRIISLVTAFVLSSMRI